jgi:chemotaxis methyl-accepting protein methylase
VSVRDLFPPLKRRMMNHLCKALKKKGTLVTDSSEILNVWQEHFETVFSKSI